MSVDLFTAGGVTIDNVVAADGTVSRGLVGGNAVYSAVGARLWGPKVGVVARIPANYPAAALAALRATGLDIAGIGVERAEIERTEWFIYEPDGSRADQLHATDADADAFGLARGRTDPATLRAWRARLAERPSRGTSYAEFRSVHPIMPESVPGSYWSARGVHVGAGEPEAMIALAEAARKRGQIVTCDPGPAAARLDGRQIERLLAAVDAFLPSEKEIATIKPGLDLEPALRGLCASGLVVVVGKRGANGCLVVDGAGLVTAIPAVPVAARDPTGAGDAFCGGFLAGFVATGDPVESARRGTVSASFAIEVPGALPPGENLLGAAEDRLHRLRRV